MEEQIGIVLSAQNNANSALKTMLDRLQELRDKYDETTASVKRLNEAIAAVPKEGINSYNQLATALDKIKRSMTSVDTAAEKTRVQSAKNQSQIDIAAEKTKAAQAKTEAAVASSKAAIDRATASSERAKLSMEKATSATTKAQEKEEQWAKMRADSMAVAERISRQYEQMGTSASEASAKVEELSRATASVRPAVTSLSNPASSIYRAPTTATNVSQMEQESLAELQRTVGNNVPESVKIEQPKISAEPYMKNFDEAQVAIERFSSAMQHASSSGRSSFESLSNELTMTANKIDNATVGLRQLNEQAEKVRTDKGEGSEEYVKLEKRILNATSALDKLNAKQQKTKESMSDLSKSESGFSKLKSTFSELSEKVKKFGNNTEKSTSKARTGLNRMLNMLKIILVYSVAFKLLSSVTQGITDSFNYMAQASGRANASMSALATSSLYLKNSIASAFEPLVQAITPALTELINKIAELFNMLGMLNAKLFGNATTVTIAKTVAVDYSKTISQSGNDAQEAASKTAASAEKAARKQKKAEENVAKAIKKHEEKIKNLQRTIHGFDELNILNKKDTWQAPTVNQADYTPTVAKWNGMPSPSSMFETVTIPASVSSIADKFKKWFADVKKDAEPTIEAFQRLKKALEPLKSFAAQGLIDFYDDFLKPVGKWVLGKGLPQLLDTTTQLVKDIDWNKLNDSLDRLWNAISPFALFVAQGAIDFYKYFLAPLAKWTLNEAFPKFSKTLLDISNNIDWDTLNKALKDFWKALEPLTEKIGDGLLWFFQNVLAPLGVWAANTVIPDVLSSISSILQIMGEALQAEAPAFELLWDYFIQPLLKLSETNIGLSLNVIKNVLKAIADLISGDGKKALQDLKDGWEEAKENVSKTSFDETATVIAAKLHTSMTIINTAYKNEMSNSEKVFSQSTKDAFKGGFMSGVKNPNEIYKQPVSSLISGMEKSYKAGIDGMNISESAKSGMKKMVQQMQPTEDQLRTIANNCKKAGQSVPENVSAGITDVEKAKALTGNVDSINYMVGQKLSTDPSFMNMLATCKDAGNSVDSNVAEGLTDNIQVVKDNATGVVTGIRDKITGKTTEITPTLRDNLSKLGVNMTDGLSSGVNSKIGDAQAAGSNVAGGVFTGADKEVNKKKKGGFWSNLWSFLISDFKKLFGIHSPSTVFNGLGQNIVQGLWDGITNIWTKLKTWWNQNIHFPKIKLPHFKITYDTTGFGADAFQFFGLAGTPSIGIDWYAKGGLFDSPSLIGVGEAGPEAVMPLNEKVFSEIAKGITENQQDKLENGINEVAMYRAFKRALSEMPDSTFTIQTDRETLAKATIGGVNSLNRQYGRQIVKI